MINIMIEGISVLADPAITMEEIQAIVSDEKRIWKDNKKEISRIEVTLDGDSIAIKSVEKSPIRRVRRITGYLSDLDKFNDAKQDELSQRQAHGLGGCCRD